MANDEIDQVNDNSFVAQRWFFFGTPPVGGARGDITDVFLIPLRLDFSLEFKKRIFFFSFFFFFS